MTDRHGPRPLLDTVRAVLDGGGRWVWFRDKDLPPRDRRALAVAVLAQVRAAGGSLSVGGDADLAAAIRADGVQLGGTASGQTIATARRRLGAQAWIGVSAHGLADVAAAAAAGADYVTLSPIFATRSKPGYGPALGLDAIAEAVRVGIPVIALGGIDAGTAPACRSAGASGIAVMGGSMQAADPAAGTRTLLRAWTGTP